MKRSGKVGLAIIAALGLASCNRRPEPMPRSSQQTSQPAQAPPVVSEATMAWDDKPRDPCSSQYFDSTLCRGAVTNHGYHYGGHWHPLTYTRPYETYFSEHQKFLTTGGKYEPTPVEVYGAGFKAPAKGTIVRGGFGSTARAMSSSSSSSSSSTPHSTSTGSSTSSTPHTATSTESTHTTSTPSEHVSSSSSHSSSSSSGS